jgi:hypothetical protein
MPQTIVASGTTFVVPDSYSTASFSGNVAECRSCHAPIIWAMHNITGKRSPLNPDGTSHFSNCPDAARFRRS